MKLYLVFRFIQSTDWSENRRVPSKSRPALGMATPTTREALVLDDEDHVMLKELASSRVAAKREVERAKMLLTYTNSKLPTGIRRTLCGVASD